MPLALARQRLLTATFPYHELKDDSRGPAGGFVYKRQQNKKGEEIGGIVPHITLESIAKNEPAKAEVLVDRPEAAKSITRITGPFTFEATIPTPLDLDQEDETQSTESGAGIEDRMLEVLRKSPVLQLGGKNTVTFKQIRKPPKTLSLSAEGLVDVRAPGQSPSLSEVCDEAEEKSGVRLPLTARPVAFVFGPENGTVTEAIVVEAPKEANAKNYTHLYVIGFGIQIAVSLCDRTFKAVGLVPGLALAIAGPSDIVKSAKADLTVRRSCRQRVKSNLRNLSPIKSNFLSNSAASLALAVAKNICLLPVSATSLK